MESRRKPTSREKCTERKTVYLEPSLSLWLEEHGQQEGRTFSGEVAFILRQYAKEQGYQKGEVDTEVVARTEIKLSELIGLLAQKGFDIVSCIV